MWQPRIAIHLRRRTVPAFAKLSTAPKPAIKIPKRIERSPTAILEALAKATIIEQDPTSPGPGILDDPFSIPATKNARDSFLLARESGRRTAQELARQWPTLFLYDRDEPRLHGFREHAQTEILESIDSEEKVKRMIEEKNVELAGKGYEKLREDGVEFSPDTQENLLELLCFYNSQPDTTLVEGASWAERVLRGTLGVDREKSNWLNNGTADILFEEIEEKTPRVYSAMIAGTATYFNQHERAELLYKEMKEKNMTPSIFAFNALISSSFSRSKNNDEQWDLVMGYLNDMKERNVAPNLGTFNATMESIAKMTKWPKAEETSIMVLNEMIQAGIEPSLYSYLCLINTYHDKSNLQGLIEQILEKLESEIQDQGTRVPERQTPFSIRDEKDITFFSQTMRMIFEKNLDVSLADRLFALYQPMLGEDPIPILEHRDSFYKLYIAISAEDKPTDVFMNIFHDIVPGLLTFDFVYGECFNHIRNNKCFQHIREMIVNARQSGAFYRLSCFRHSLTLIGEASAADSMPTRLRDDLVTSVKDLYDFVDNQEIRERDGRRVMNMPWTANLVTSLAHSAAKCGDLSLAKLILKKCDVSEPEGAKPLDEDDETRFMAANRPHSFAVDDLAQKFHQAGDREMAIKILSIGVDHGLRVNGTIKKLEKAGMKLSEKEKKALETKEAVQDPEFSPPKSSLGRHSD